MKKLRGLIHSFYISGKLNAENHCNLTTELNKVKKELILSQIELQNFLVKMMETGNQAEKPDDQFGNNCEKLLKVEGEAEFKKGMSSSSFQQVKKLALAVSEQILNFEYDSINTINDIKKDNSCFLRILIRDCLLNWSRKEQEAFAEYIATFLVPNHLMYQDYYSQEGVNNFYSLLQLIVGIDIQHNFQKNQISTYFKKSFTVVLFQKLCDTFDGQQFVSEQFQSVFDQIDLKILENQDLNQLSEDVQRTQTMDSQWSISKTGEKLKQLKKLRRNSFSSFPQLDVESLVFRIEVEKCQKKIRKRKNSLKGETLRDLIHKPRNDSKIYSIISKFDPKNQQESNASPEKVLEHCSGVIGQILDQVSKIPPKLPYALKCILFMIRSKIDEYFGENISEDHPVVRTGFISLIYKTWIGRCLFKTPFNQSLLGSYPTKGLEIIFDQINLLTNHILDHKTSIFGENNPIFDFFEDDKYQHFGSQLIYAICDLEVQKYEQPKSSIGLKTDVCISKGLVYRICESILRNSDEVEGKQERALIESIQYLNEHESLLLQIAGVKDKEIKVRANCSKLAPSTRDSTQVGFESTSKNHSVINLDNYEEIETDYVENPEEFEKADDFDMIMADLYNQFYIFLQEGSDTEESGMKILTAKYIKLMKPLSKQLEDDPKNKETKIELERLRFEKTIIQFLFDCEEFDKNLFSKTDDQDFLESMLIHVKYKSFQDRTPGVELRHFELQRKILKTSFREAELTNETAIEIIKSITNDVSRKLEESKLNSEDKILKLGYRIQEMQAAIDRNNAKISKIKEIEDNLNINAVLDKIELDLCIILEHKSGYEDTYQSVQVEKKVDCSYCNKAKFISVDDSKQKVKPRGFFSKLLTPFKPKKRKFSEITEKISYDHKIVTTVEEFCQEFSKYPIQRKLRTLSSLNLQSLKEVQNLQNCYTKFLLSVSTSLSEVYQGQQASKMIFPLNDYVTRKYFPCPGSSLISRSSISQKLQELGDLNTYLKSIFSMYNSQEAISVPLSFSTHNTGSQSFVMNQKNLEEVIASSGLEFDLTRLKIEVSYLEIFAYYDGRCGDDEDVGMQVDGCKVLLSDVKSWIKVMEEQ
ncbi:unnamed protein product [Moneuplotes crassus]|uniref:Uncharacterized protein n=1 Tax=Euplotes crassus TaxID=5936 RepID=A0AAD1XJR1_EUPCR|nr:unnamed protein product [Moneuplotes crassus]